MYECGCSTSGRGSVGAFLMAIDPDLTPTLDAIEERLSALEAKPAFDPSKMTVTIKDLTVMVNDTPVVITVEP